MVDAIEMMIDLKRSSSKFIDFFDINSSAHPPNPIGQPIPLQYRQNPDVSASYLSLNRTLSTYGSASLHPSIHPSVCPKMDPVLFNLDCLFSDLVITSQAFKAVGQIGMGGWWFRMASCHAICQSEPGKKNRYRLD